LRNAPPGKHPVRHSYKWGLTSKSNSEKPDAVFYSSPISRLPRQVEKWEEAAKSRSFFRAGEEPRRAGECRAYFLVRSLRVQRMNENVGDFFR